MTNCELLLAASHVENVGVIFDDNHRTIHFVDEDDKQVCMVRGFNEREWTTLKVGFLIGQKCG